MQAFGWSLHDLDRTDIESLIPFVRQLTAARRQPSGRRVYADQAHWL